MTDKEELRSLLALTRVNGLGMQGAQHLLSAFGSAAAVFENQDSLRDAYPRLSAEVASRIGDSEHFRRADAELAFVEENHLHLYTQSDEQYPVRLRECDDAPLLLFGCGDAHLNAARIVSVVGTRHITPYGREACDTLVHRLAELLPGTLIVSGLAYGVDVCAHTAALDSGLPTVGVLAHGLDTLYPAAHRNIAAQMCASGGLLLTEYMSGTFPDKPNFVRRNRIVAGMADAVVVVESARKGGALITADIAQSYNRDCFAFPGRAGDTYSQGCNALIRDNRAALITCADDLVQAMRWDTPDRPPQPVQRQLFVELTEPERLLHTTLLGEPDGLQVNQLVVRCNLPVQQVQALLFSLEMKGAVKNYAGGMYRAL